MTRHLDSSSASLEISPLSYEHQVVAHLVERYGLLMTLEQLAEMLDRSPQGLRTRQNSGAKGRLYQVLRAARRKIGRRSFYDPRVLAHLLEG